MTKKIYMIVLASDSEMGNLSDKITDRFPETDKSKVYCGSWGEIKSNREECLNAISSTVNYFIKKTEVEEICFGCNIKDVLAIKSLLSLDDCEITEINSSEM
ncbi:MAG: hypothetical protein IJB24_04775 [Clostridia bacterium]|nr:hypothetical protein [Clostridia bacterium]